MFAASLRKASRHTRAGVLALTVVVLGCAGDTTFPTGPEAKPVVDAAASAALSFRQVSVGDGFSCGVTTADRAYCWGSNRVGTLGTGSTTGPEVCQFEWGCSTRPAAVAGGFAFRQVSAGGEHACAVTTDDRVYCWGSNDSGQLGDGTTTLRPAPVPVAADRRFRQVTAGSWHTCAVTLSDRVFCWGYNGAGQLGDSSMVNRLTPVRVHAAGLLFRRVTAGGTHTCAVTAAGRAYCWGNNEWGQLGDRTKTARLTPVAVYGGLSFRSANAGQFHTCAVTTADRAFCWGYNFGRVLGDGSDAPRRLKPTAVVGDLEFRQVAAGSQRTCGVTIGRAVYCWGSSPTLVEGGLSFDQVEPSGSHACGLTTSGLAYCWGRNSAGELADGTRTDRPTPVAVLAPM